MFELVLTGSNRFKPVATGYNRFLQCWNCFATGLNRFKPVAAGNNRFLQCLNWFETGYKRVSQCLNLLQPVKQPVVARFKLVLG